MRKHLYGQFTVAFLVVVAMIILGVQPSGASMGGGGFQSGGFHGGGFHGGGFHGGSFHGGSFHGGGFHGGGFHHSTVVINSRVFVSNRAFVGHVPCCFRSHVFFRPCCFGPRVFVGVGIGAPLFLPYSVGYPYPVYSAPAVVEASPAYAQPDVQPAQQNWYYCQESQAYYPYVKACPGGWLQVAPQPSPLSQ